MIIARPVGCGLIAGTPSAAFASLAEQGILLAFGPPGGMGFVSGLFQCHPLFIDRFDPRRRHGMMNAASILVGFRKDDAVAAQAIDRSDMLTVAADDFHMVVHLLHRLALFGATTAPAAELAVEPIAMLALIFGIVPIQFINPLLAPRIIVGVMMRPIIMGRPIRADAVAMVFAAKAAAFAGEGGIAPVREILVAA
jgi:hypothetical protein